MIKIPYYDRSGKPLEPIEVDPEWFGGKVRQRLLKEAILQWEANQRVGTHQAKTRGEVAGSPTKVWRQKGTGRARQGTKRSPIWRHGSKAHGPRPRDYSLDMPKRKRRAALNSALLAKLKDSQVLVIEALALEANKTRHAAKLLSTIGVEGKCLIGVETHDEQLYRAFRNIPRLAMAEVRNWNPHQVVNGGTLLLTRSALDGLVAARKKGEK